jgi:hypothetical protein
VSTYKPELSNDFYKVKLKNESFIGAPGNTHAWVIKSFSSWNSPDKWREELSPFWDAIKK